MTDSLIALRIYLTGGVRIECSGTLIDQTTFAFPYCQLALAYLVCERGRPVARAEIVRVIWDDAPPADADAIVRSVVHKLRKALSRDAVAGDLQLVGTGPYELKAPSNAWVDTEAAADAIHDAEGELRASRPRGAFGPSAIAHHIARRPFLPGEHGRWAEAQRERLRGILIRALECRGEVFIWNRELPLAVEAAKEAIALEPFRETAHQLLIRAHAALGNAAEAKRAYERCRASLAEQLRIDPSAQTQMIYQSAIASTTPAIAQSPPASSRGTALGSGANFASELQRLLGDAFIIEQEIGGGGMSRAFLAEERALERHVVIKVLPPDKAETLSAERFTREVRLAAKLQQANIVPLLSAAVVGGLPYYTMPYVSGESLRALLSAREPLPIRRVTSIMRDVARALAFAHANGVVHRDIKPENILLSAETAVVTDFGIAKALSDAETTRDATTMRLTNVGTSIGTPLYMSPEQVAGDPAIDHRADIYSFGIVAYELLTGRAPFADRPTQAALAAQLVEAPRPVEELRSDTPYALAELVMHCVQKNPDTRPQNMQVVLSRLE